MTNRIISSQSYLGNQDMSVSSPKNRGIQTMNWKIDWEGNLMIVSVAGRLAARFAPEFRDEVLSKMTPEIDVLFDLS